MIIIPRLDKQLARELLSRHLSLELQHLAQLMPDLSPSVTYTPVGGQRIDEAQLAALRARIVDFAASCGMPSRLADASVFEGQAARILYEMLPMSPNEAAQEEVWSYLTCCWLLDIAVWRFGAGADERRFIGDVNRNTFRRLWWRAHILGDGVDLTQFGEDELVNITERPTIAQDKRLARAIANEFLTRVGQGNADQRMFLMREAMKRFVRATPLVSFMGLRDDELAESVAQVFNAAAEGISGSDAPGGRHRRGVGDRPYETQAVVPPASPGVEIIDR